MPKPKKPDPRVYLRGGVYWGEYYPAAGKRVRRSTRQRDEAAALDIVREWEQDAADPVRAAARETTLAHVLGDFVAERDAQAKAGRRSPATVTFYGERAAVLLLVLGDTFKAADLTAAVIDEYIAERRLAGVTESTIAKDLVTLRAAFRLAKRRGKWAGEIDAVFPVQFAPEYKPRERFLTPEELRELLPRLWLDDAARVAFAVATSAELGVTDRALRADVAEDKSRVLLRGTKRELRFRTAPIVAPWQRDLLEYALKHAQGQNGRLFTPGPKLFQGRLADACAATLKRPTLPHLSPNDLRRTCATWLRAQGVPPDLIAAVLGHTDGRMVERVYGRLKPAALAARLRVALGENASSPDCAVYVPDKGEEEGFSGQIGRLDDLPEPRGKRRKVSTTKGKLRATG